MPKSEYYHKYKSDPKWVSEQYKKKNESRRNIRIKAQDILGGKCVVCGFSDWRALHVDHVVGNGNEERKKRNNQQLQSDIVFGRHSGEGLQLLCANCNDIKRFENKEGVVL